MFNKKLLKEMTIEEKLKAIRKMPDDELRCMQDIQELSSKEQEVVTDELARRRDKLSKENKIFGVASIITGLTLCALELIISSEKN